MSTISFWKQHGKAISNVLVVLLVVGAIYAKIQDNGVDSLFRLTDLSNGAFGDDTALRDLVNFDPTGIRTIGSNVFQNNYSLFRNGLALPAATSIGSRAFYCCYSLPWIEIGGANCAVGSEAFSTCVSLGSVRFTANVASIGASAFNNCRSLREIDLSHCTAVPTLANTNAFTNCTALARILVPSALLADWSAAENWATYASKLVGVTAA